MLKWQQMVSGELIIIEAEWTNLYNFITTAAQLRVCKVPQDHGVTRIVTFRTGMELDLYTPCKGLLTAEKDTTCKPARILAS